MSTADQLLPLIYSWIKERERCADQLIKLARELESLREKCNVGKCVGSTTSVVGAACVIGAGLVTLFTGGAAAPILGGLGSLYTGVGLTISVASKITEAFLSSDTMKEVKKVQKRSNEIADEIQQLFDKLRAEAEAENPSADPDELDQCIISKILTSMAKGSGLKSQDKIPNGKLSGGPTQSGVKSVFIATAFTVFVMVGVLAFFRLQPRGKKYERLFAEGFVRLNQQMSITPLQGGAMVMQGTVLLTFALEEAIENWTDMIKNNHVTKASQSLRDMANSIRKVTCTLREQLDSIKKTLDEIAECQEEQEEKKRKKKRKANVCFVLTVQSNSLADDSHGNTEARAKDQHRETDKNGQEGGQRETNGGRESGRGNGGGKKSDSKDEDGSQSDQESDNEEEDGSQSDEESDSDEDSSSKKIIKKLSKFLRMALLNVHSIKNKLLLISDLLDEYKLQVLFLTETWLKPDTGGKVLTEFWPNFQSLQQARETRGGGVAVLSSRALEAERIDSGSNTSFEYLVALMRHEMWNQPILTVTLYRRPGYNVTGFLEELQRLLVEFSNYNSIIVTGDFNIWVDDDTKKPVRRFKQFLEDNGLCQHVEGPTYRSGHTLDLVISRNVEVSNLFIPDERVSDHYTIIFTVRPLSSKEEDKEEEEEEERKRIKTNRS